MKPVIPGLFVLAASAVISANQVLAQDQALAQDLTCDSIYMVQPGDSLSKIAGRVYGRTSAYQIIFDYNTGLLSNPNELESFVGLYIPCAEDSDLPPDQDNQAELAQLPPASANRLKVLTGSEYPPYVDEGLPNGGFSVELIQRSLLENDGAEDFRIDVINDWSSHLNPLLSDGAYDVAFPWFRPDCTQQDRLGESSVWRCKNLRFSEPLHDVVVSFHTTKKMAKTITSEQDMQGLRICRPRGYFTHDLEAMGLTPPNYERIAPRQPLDCFAQLIEGTVDIVTVNADTSDQALGELEIHDMVTELIDFASVQSLRAVVMKNSPDGRVNLLRINQGLRALRNSGDFRKIAKTHLAGQ